MITTSRMLIKVVNSNILRIMIWQKRNRKQKAW